MVHEKTGIYMVGKNNGYEYRNQESIIKYRRYSY